MAKTRLELITLAKEYADLNNSGFVSDASWTLFVNIAQKRTFGTLCALHEDYFLTSSNFNLVNGTQDYNLPADFWKIRGVDFLPGGVADQAYTVYPYNWAQRNRLKYLTVFSPPLYSSNLRYRLLASTIRFEPIPSDSTTVARLWYIQAPTDLAIDSSTTIIPDMFMEYLCLQAAYQALRKQEVDLTFIREDIKEAREDMKEAAKKRKADLPPTISIIENDYEGQSSDGYADSTSRIRHS